MAVNRRKNTIPYRTYGSAAYSPAYDGNAARGPRREEEPRRAPVPQPKKPVRRQERARVEVRQAGAVAPFAVVGFLAVAVFAIMLITSYTQLMVASNEMVSLRRELSSLQSENAKLSAQYEKVFDLATIQAVVGDTMVRPTNEQVVYIDLSAPDTVTVYQSGGGVSLFQSIVDGVGDIFGSIIEYFR